MTVCKRRDNLRRPAARCGKPTTAVGVEAYRQGCHCVCVYECVTLSQGVAGGMRR